jgi:hypothetical protein
MRQINFWGVNVENKRVEEKEEKLLGTFRRENKC